jgi:hypothetical protein
MQETQTETEYTEKGREMLQTADALEELATELRNADSIADDVPVLSELFHIARTSSRRPREGKYVALLDYDTETDQWSCRSVSFLQNGTHYRDTGADKKARAKPRPFYSVDEFGQNQAATFENQARRLRQNAHNYRTEK